MKTVLGEVDVQNLGITLPHEHICCYSEYIYQMAGDVYLDKKYLVRFAAKRLHKLKAEYGLSTFIDCTPINLGRDIEVLKQVSELSGVHILCSTGLYFTREPLFNRTTPMQVGKYLTLDIQKTGASIIKCAVEEKECSPFDEKVLRGCAIAHKETGIPIVLHTNAKRKNAQWAMELLLSEGVEARSITIGHLSDAEDDDYLLSMASYGAYIGLDRIYNDTTREYIEKKLDTVRLLVEKGYGDKILLSHDDQFFNGFDAEPKCKENTRFSYCFDYLMPNLTPYLQNQILVTNPARMLLCQ